MSGAPSLTTSEVSESAPADRKVSAPSGTVRYQFSKLHQFSITLHHIYLFSQQPLRLEPRLRDPQLTAERQIGSKRGNAETKALKMAFSPCLKQVWGP